ncbi:MAG TPA: helix-turn-helix transcriptional regulator [Pyrinomonadaceae bacterium]|nr:helix-turn-helix transcriptional regulator [Pyrinomonadaceae bacterium]
MGRSHRPMPDRLPEKLRYIRRHLDLTQEQMVARLKAKLHESHESEVPLYPGHISGYERGIREPPLVVLLQYARLASVPLENLVDDSLDLPGYYLRYRIEDAVRERKRYNPE